MIVNNWIFWTRLLLLFATFEVMDTVNKGGFVKFARICINHGFVCKKILVWVRMSSISFFVRKQAVQVETNISSTDKNFFQHFPWILCLGEWSYEYLIVSLISWLLLCLIVVFKLILCDADGCAYSVIADCISFCVNPITLGTFFRALSTPLFLFVFGQNNKFVCYNLQVSLSSVAVFNGYLCNYLYVVLWW